MALFQTLVSVAALARGGPIEAGASAADGWTMLGSSRDLADVMARVALRDREAFRTLYRATSAKLYGIILKILNRRGPADEILQEVYLKIWERAGDFDPLRASPITWLATIARNRALDELRRQQVIPTDGIDDGMDFIDEAEGALEGLERADKLRALMACLNGLEKERRELILLAYYRGLSRDVLAQRFGHPVATIKTWLHRSLAQLRVCLAQ